jgi:preprotein translocase subunit YajC
LNSPVALFAAAPAGGNALLMNLLPILLIIVVFYFLMLRPNQKRQRQWAAQLEALKPGDRVTTTGGVRGVILALKDDAIVLRLPPDNVKMEVVKSAIASVTQDETK